MLGLPDGKVGQWPDSTALPDADFFNTSLSIFQRGRSKAVGRGEGEVRNRFVYAARGCISVLKIRKPLATLKGTVSTEYRII